MARLSMRFLGPFRVALDGKPVDGFKSDKARALLAYLAVEAGRPHSRQTLAGLLWPDWPEQAAHTSLRSALSNLRKIIGDSRASPPFLSITRETIQFNPASDYWLDVTAFRASLAEDRFPQAGIAQLEQAAALYCGGFLEGFGLKDSPAFEEWVLLKREQLNQQALSVLHRLGVIYEARREYEHAIPYAWRQVELEPWLDESHQQLMRLLALNGQRGAALAQYESCCKLLAKELGVEPAAETILLYENIRDGSLVKAVEAQRGLPAPGRPPYKGLEYFNEDDADFFFGRELLTAKLIARLQETLLPGPEATQEGIRFLAVLGASGSGKSSIVRAGLIPALKSGQPLANGMLPPTSSARWPIHVITPTAHPLAALAASLTSRSRSTTASARLSADLARDPRSLHRSALSMLTPDPYPLPLSRIDAERKGNLLLVVDQFEELFTLCRDEAERKAFVDNLLYAAGARRAESEPTGGGDDGLVIVVIALRADFYAHCAPYPDLRQALSQRQEYIGPMNAAELRQAIEKPAQRGGWSLEPGLVDLLLHDSGAEEGKQPEPGALPLLSHALLETWERRRGRTLTLSGYAEAGGIRGAITHTAETTFARLSPEEQAIARSIFLQLTELGEAGADTRRRATLTELVPPPEEAPAQSAATATTLKALVEARLITTSAETAEVAHEALIREWSRLRQWLEENRASLRQHRQITAAAQAWERLQRDPGALNRGMQLAQALEWAKAHAKDLNLLERAFLEQSNAWAEKEAAEREAQRQRELEAARKLAEAERQRAQEEARNAEQLRRRALFLIGAFILAAILAAAALFLGRQARLNANQAEQEALTARSQELAAQAINNLETDPERSILLALQAVSAAKTLEAENALHRAVQASRAVLTLSGHTGDVWAVAFSPDGKRIATASADGTAMIWDASTGVVLSTLTGHSDEVVNLAYSPDGERLATASLGGTIRLWNASTGEALFTFSISTGDSGAIAFSPDGAHLVTAGEAGAIIFWNSSSGERLLTLSAHASQVSDLAFSPDGERLATASEGGEAKVWNVAGLLALAEKPGTSPPTGQELLTLTGHTNTISDLAFSPDGTRLATASFDLTAKVWDASNGELLLTLSGHTNGLRGVAFSSEESILVTGGQDGIAKVWDATSGEALFTLAGQPGAVNAVAISPDGSRAATAGRDGTAKVWDISPTGRGELLTATGFAGIFGPAGARLTTVDFEGSNTLKIQEWDLSPAIPLAPIHTATLNHAAPVVAGTFSPDRKRVATASADMLAHVWDLASGQELYTFSIGSHTDGVAAIDVSPNGARLATASYDGTARIWDMTSGKELLSLSGETDQVWGVAFSPDGKRIATGNTDNTAVVWDAASGQPLLTLRGHGMVVTSVAFSPYGNFLATGSMDGTAKIWDTLTGQVLHTLSGHTATLLGVTFSPDGEYLVTASNDGTAKVWDVERGQVLLTLTGHVGMVSAVSFSPDGTRLVTGSYQDGTVRVYLLRIEDLVALAKTRLTRWFTLAECRQYLHTEQCPARP